MDSDEPRDVVEELSEPAGGAAPAPYKRASVYKRTSWMLVPRWSLAHKKRQSQATGPKRLVEEPQWLCAAAEQLQSARPAAGQDTALANTISAASGDVAASRQRCDSWMLVKAGATAPGVEVSSDPREGGGGRGVRGGDGAELEQLEPKWLLEAGERAGGGGRSAE